MIQTKHIFLDQEQSTREAVFEFLAKAAVQSGFAEEEKEVYEKLNEREEEGATGMMGGFAIPHAKAETIKEANILILRLKQGIEWNSLDGQPIDFIIGLFIPKTEEVNTHLKLLSNTARLLMSEEVTTGLKEAENEQEIADLLNRKLAEKEEAQ